MSNEQSDREALIEQLRGTIPLTQRWGMERVYAAAADMLEATRPRVVETVEELEALPIESVVMEAPDQFAQRGAIYEAADLAGWPYKWMFGDEQTVPSTSLRLPVTVLFLGGEGE